MPLEYLERWRSRTNFLATIRLEGSRWKEQDSHHHFPAGLDREPADEEDIMDRWPSFVQTITGPLPRAFRFAGILSRLG